MEWAPWASGVRCPTCESTWTDRIGFCPSCSGPLEVEYDGDAPPSLDDIAETWRFAGYVPFDPADRRRRAVGETPLCPADWLADQLGVETAYLKDEGRNPTGHLSDRDMTLVAADASTRTTQRMALPTTGRSGIAAAAAAAAVDIDSHAVVPSRSPFAVKALINVHGGTMRVVRGRFPDARAAYEEAASAADWQAADPMANPLAREARKTVYLEVLGALDWQAPDAFVFPSGTGATALAVARAADEAVSRGLVETVPRLVLAQPAGCGPLARALERGDPVRPWADPDTICGELEIPDPQGANLVAERLGALDAEAAMVADETALETAVRIAQHDGLEPSVAGGVAAGGALEVDPFDPTDTVVVLNPGSATTDADILRSYLMSQGV